MYSVEMDLAKKAAMEAGKFLREKKDIAIDDSSGKDLKLSSDKISEKIILDILKGSDLPVLSEECGRTEALGDKYWIVDPLDGTVNYYKGMEDFACVSIALWDGGKPVMGVIYRFMREELFYGCLGDGAYLNGESIKPSGVQKVSQGVLATGFPVKRSYDAESLGTFIKKVQRFKKIRMLGAAALMGVFVACGRVDAYMEEEIMLWDVCAAVAIVNAAGGVAEAEGLGNDKCICRCFASQALREDYHAQGI